MGHNTISQKIDSYAQANFKELKQEEAKTGRKMTKYDIAQYMLQQGKLDKNEYANWMNTTEGFNAQAMTQKQIIALKQGNVWGFAGYGGGEESYLDSMISFSQKDPVEKFNAVYSTNTKLNETIAERKKKSAEIQKHIQEQRVAKQVLNPNEALKEQKIMNDIRSLPEVNKTYTELMNDIKFQNMDKKQKTEFLLKTTGQKFYEAKERGDKEAMKEYLKQGFALTFAYMDDKAGITDIKEAAKKYSGLNAVVDAIDKFVDDGDDSNLSFGEKTWETIKGAGDAVDGFIGTQGVAFMGTLAVAGEAAAAAGISKAFALVTQAYFAIEGGTMVVDGAVDVANAQTKEEARAGGQELGTGAIMLGGALKSAKEGYNNYKMEKSAQQELSNARKTLGLDDGVELTESAIKNAKKGLALKNHPDRGGSVETMQEINNAANLLLKSLNTGSARAAVATGRPAETVNTPNTPAVKTMSSPKIGTAPTIPTTKMAELAKTPEGIKQMEDAGLVVSKASIDKLGTIHEGQSQSPARAVKKIDFSGTPEEVCTKNPPLQYDKARGKFFREVSWDQGKTKQPMYIEENDPNGYFMINYGEESWDGALLGGTEAIKSYVEPEAYNANGTKIPLDPAKMDYNWTTASKAAPVRFAKVPKGMKGVVGKEGFQPITGDNQVIAMDVKGQPYINTAQYVLDNTKGLDAQSIKALMEIDPSADASKAILDIARTESGLKELNDVGITVERLKAYVDRDGHSVTHGITIDQKNADGNLTTRTYIESLDDSDVGFKSKITTTQYNPNSGIPVESKTPNGIIKYDTNGNVSLVQETVTPSITYGLNLESYDAKKTTVSYEYDQDGLIIKKDIKNDYENLRRTGSEEFVLRDLTEKTKYGTHRKQIKIVNGFKVGIEEIPNKDGSTTIKLVNYKGQCVTREIPKGKKYEINAGLNELRDGVDVSVYEYGKTTDKETLMSIEKGYYFEPPKTDFTQYKHYNRDIIPVAPDITTPKTSLETNFFEE